MVGPYIISYDIISYEMTNSYQISHDNLS